MDATARAGVVEQSSIQRGNGGFSFMAARRIDGAWSYAALNFVMVSTISMAYFSTSLKFARNRRSISCITILTDLCTVHDLKSPGSCNLNLYPPKTRWAKPHHQNRRTCRAGDSRRVRIPFCAGFNAGVDANTAGGE